MLSTETLINIQPLPVPGRDGSGPVSLKSHAAEEFLRLLTDLFDL